ncbi:hypothetical protein Hanom_Chr05g00399441 [Helianthus anomalus]
MLNEPGPDNCPRDTRGDSVVLSRLAGEIAEKKMSLIDMKGFFRVIGYHWEVTAGDQRGGRTKQQYFPSYAIIQVDTSCFAILE